jgi:pyruvate-ferredoxin/flavodoxin oxidoreductase
VTGLSLAVDESFDVEPKGAVRAVFFGLGADGTVGANKNSIKIIGEDTDLWAQGYFVYDSKKSGAVTVSHLRFGQNPIHAPYLIKQASFVACHQFNFLDRLDIASLVEPGGTLLLNSRYGPDEIWDELPMEVQNEVIERRINLYTIDAYDVAKSAGLGLRINTIMQTCFFAISGVMPREQAIAKIKSAVKKSYGKRGDAVVQKNFAVIDAALDHLHAVPVPGRVSSSRGGRRQCRMRRRISSSASRPSCLPTTVIVCRSALSRRWHVADRHVEVGEAEHRRRVACVGRRPLHSVQQVRARLPARGDSRQGVR